MLGKASVVPVGSVTHTRGFGATSSTVTVKSLSAADISEKVAARPDRRFAITAKFDASITNDPNAATIQDTINQAIANFESAITTPINVAIKFQQVPTGLGASETWLSLVTYEEFRSRLTASPNSADDSTALITL